MIWPIIFSGDSYGYANSILMRLGIIHSPILWFTDVNYMNATGYYCYFMD